MLESCQVEHNPLPLLLTLPSLASITIRAATRGSSEASLPLLLPMRQPQQPLRQARPRAGYRTTTAAAAAAIVAAAAPAAAAVAPAPAGDGASFSAADDAPFGHGSHTNTSITSLSLVDVGMRQLPGCISQLVSLAELYLGLNHDLGAQPASCLPPELTSLSGKGAGREVVLVMVHLAVEHMHCLCSTDSLRLWCQVYCLPDHTALAPAHTQDVHYTCGFPHAMW